jgi:Fanconi anemia group F protein (FANCF)
MAWSHADISIDNLLSLIKAFVDMLVLASGYQSSGLTAKWDPQNVTKAIRWGLFFEEVSKSSVS